VSGHAALERELTGVGLVFLSMTVGGLVFSGLRLPPLLGYLAAGLASQWLLRPFPSLLLLSTIGVILVFFFSAWNLSGNAFSLPHIGSSPSL